MVQNKFNSTNGSIGAVIFGAVLGNILPGAIINGFIDVISF